MEFVGYENNIVDVQKDVLVFKEHTDCGEVSCVCNLLSNGLVKNTITVISTIISSSGQGTRNVQQNLIKETEFEQRTLG